MNLDEAIILLRYAKGNPGAMQFLALLATSDDYAVVFPIMEKVEQISTLRELIFTCCGQTYVEWI